MHNGRRNVTDSHRKLGSFSERRLQCGLSAEPVSPLYVPGATHGRENPRGEPSSLSVRQEPGHIGLPRWRNVSLSLISEAHLP
ncbi:hypothetical protein SKAU_G00381640 [Synaphobranchus kaupii]|uniref:Uncharacterized protein n=1 Tax=Synaphobranchus kaupii TaxID=118154 RepID=A0A9Q1IER5_SYNKA|nr:hypothetical protein SKAU_G00381640 [Synaphobranchus kaupii]